MNIRTTYFDGVSKEEIEEYLNEMYIKGWEFISMNGLMYIFKNIKTPVDECVHLQESHDHFFTSCEKSIETIYPFEEYIKYEGQWCKHCGRKISALPLDEL